MSNKKDEILIKLNEVENLVRGLDFSATDVNNLYFKMNESLEKERNKLRDHLHDALIFNHEPEDLTLLESILGYQIDFSAKNKVAVIKILRKEFGFSLPDCRDIWELYKEE